MPSNNTKYSEEMRREISKLIIETGKSATSMAEEMGIDVNTVCRWVRDYRRNNKLPSYAESKGIKARAPISDKEIMNKNKELEKKVKRYQKELVIEQEKVEILKKSLHIFMQQKE
jgi:Transposase.